MAKIIFRNNTDYKKGIAFSNVKEFLEFANRYISHPSAWGNLYWQEVTGINIKWSIRKGGWIEEVE